MTGKLLSRFKMLVRAQRRLQQMGVRITAQQVLTLTKHQEPVEWLLPLCVEMEYAKLIQAKHTQLVQLIVR